MNQERVHTNRNKFCNKAHEWVMLICKDSRSNKRLGSIVCFWALIWQVGKLNKSCHEKAVFLFLTMNYFLVQTGETVLI